jgi:amidase
MKISRRRFVRHGSHSLAALAASGCGLPGADPEQITDLTQADGIAQAMLLSKGEVSAAELLQTALDRAAAVNDKINAIVTPTYETARERAAAGAFSGPLQGVPYLIKDLTDVAGVRTTHGCRAFMDRIAERDAPIVQAVKAGGVNIIGKSNTPEFGLVGTTESLALGPCRNPWNLDHSTGGSSGGAAAAVAAGIVPAAQASDGGGSIRNPASCCGLVGLKPSRGRMLGEGSHTQVTQISVRHAVTRSVRDSAVLLAIGETQGGAAGLQPVGFVAEPIQEKLKIAFSTTTAKGTQPDADVLAAQRQVAQLCADLGHEVIEAAPQYDGEVFESAFLDLWSQNGWSVREQLLNGGVPQSQLQQLLEPWTLYLAEHFESVGQQGLARVVATFGDVKRTVETFMQDYDAWLTPVLTSAPPRIGEQGPSLAPQALKQRTLEYVGYTPLANALGAPAISLPLSWNTAGLPIGSMFMAKYGQESLLLQLAYQLELAQPWTDKRPPLIAPL